jgi:hypothetical protein
MPNDLPLWAAVAWQTVLLGTGDLLIIRMSKTASGTSTMTMKQAAALPTDPGQPLGCAHHRLVLDKLDLTIQDDSNRNNGAKHELCNVYGE